ncbi:hypothetical protein OESDEN_04121 [Oesophagostomum dentatum]|uniref:Uncharacterized protein n=1 Tax=Oesophagostomum dentatum TaxID=61180 RepID=A0A0B1TF76_OESDE|nr:hypothetical protein OESDEN_04121 [Oesophagostomum dentatum]
MSDFTQRATYCSSSTPSSANRITVLCFSLSGLNFITLIGITTIFTFNNIALKRFFRKVFDLQSSYQLQENVSVIRLILPLTTFQTLSYLLFTASNGTMGLLRESFAPVTYHTIFAATYVS